MNMNMKPWPHSPGVIAQVEFYRDGRDAPADIRERLAPEIAMALAITPLELRLAVTEFEARIFNEVARFATYNEAVIWIEEQKALRAEAELEANISVWGAPSGCSCNLCTRKLSSSIADEMSA